MPKYDNTPTKSVNKEHYPQINMSTKEYTSFDKAYRVFMKKRHIFEPYNNIKKWEKEDV